MPEWYQICAVPEAKIDRPARLKKSRHSAGYYLNFTAN
jgi:hypothetical protein